MIGSASDLFKTKHSFFSAQRSSVRNVILVYLREQAEQLSRVLRESPPD